jgi:beta-glucosidase-like glycosyl hydrolase
MLDALAVGNIVPSDVALAARRLLKPTVELGLLDGPDAPLLQLGPDDIDTPANRQLAFEAGAEAVTLLKNAKPPGASAPLLPGPGRLGAVKRP